MNEPRKRAQLQTRRHLLGSAAAAGLWFPTRAAGQADPATTPATTRTSTGERLLTQFITEVLNGRSVEHLDVIAHSHIQYPTGRMVGLDGFREIWTADATQRGTLNMVDEYQTQVILGNEQWGMAYLVYTVRTADNVLFGKWHLAYVAQVVDGRIGTLDVVIDEQEQD